MRTVRHRRPRRASRTAKLSTTVGVASCGALAVAALAEHGLGIVPCALCLAERWPWRVAIGLSLLGLLLPGRAGRAALFLLLPVLAVSAVLGATHVGVEQGMWPSPFPSCRAGRLGAGSIGDQLLAMPLHAAKPCDTATDLIPHVPLSMAAMDLILSLALLLLVAAGMAGRHARR